MEQSRGTSLNLESLHADSLIWSSKQIEGGFDQNKYNEESLFGSRQNSNILRPKLKQTKNNQGLLYIKPDYGSLGQFITGVNLSTDFLKQKKKKTDGQQEAEQKRMRSHLHNRNLNKILSNPQSSTQQRSVACKLLIERTFQQAFGMSITEFHQEQIQRMQPQQKKGTLNINSLSDALDEIVNKSRERVQEKPNSSMLFLKQNMRKNRSCMRGKTIFQNEREVFLKKLNNLKTSYRSLHKNIIPQQPTSQYQELLNQYSTNTQSYPLFNHNRKSSHSSSSTHQQSSPFQHSQEKAFIVTPNAFIINNINQISSQTILYALTKLNLDSLQEVSLLNSTFSNPDSINLALDLIGSDSKNLKALLIQDTLNTPQYKSKDKLSHKVKVILQNTSQSLQLLKLNNLSLQTKDFCVLCLGIGSSQKLQKVQMKNNNIDEHAKKSYDVITKFFKELQIDLQGNPLYNQIFKVKLKGSKVSLK